MTEDTIKLYEFPDANASPSIAFSFQGETKGSLYVNPEGRLEFKGDMEESARIFLTSFCNLFNNANQIMGNISSVNVDAQYTNHVTLTICAEGIGNVPAGDIEKLLENMFKRRDN